MKSATNYLSFNTKKRRELVNITAEVEQFIKESKIKEGFVLVSAMHITAGIFVNDHESGLWKDIDEMLERLAPSGKDYHHHHTGEDNGEAHLRNLLVGSQVMIPITDGKFDSGPWQQIFYAEFDGQRPKRVLLKAIGE